jgi:hypothetical protein
MQRPSSRPEAERVHSIEVTAVTGAWPACSTLELPGFRGFRGFRAFRGFRGFRGFRVHIKSLQKWPALTAASCHGLLPPAELTRTVPEKKAELMPVEDVTLQPNHPEDEVQS